MVIPHLNARYDMLDTVRRENVRHSITKVRKESLHISTPYSRSHLADGECFAKLFTFQVEKHVAHILLNVSRTSSGRSGSDGRSKGKRLGIRSIRR